MKKPELYRQWPSRRVKDKKLTEIENTLSMRSVMKMTPVYYIEREPWSTGSILRRVNDGVYRFICSIRYDEYMCKTKHAFVYDSHFKPLHQ